MQFHGICVLNSVQSACRKFLMFKAQLAFNYSSQFTITRFVVWGQSKARKVCPQANEAWYLHTGKFQFAWGHTFLALDRLQCWYGVTF